MSAPIEPASPRRTLPQRQSRSAELLDAARTRIQGRLCAERIWREVLTPAERQQLGDDFEGAAKYGAAGIWMRLYGHSAPRSICDVALKLGCLSQQEHAFLLRELGEISNDVEAAIASAVATGDIVLVERPRTVYWEQQQIEIDWGKNGAVWNYLVELVAHAQRGQPIDLVDVAGEPLSDVIGKPSFSVKHNPHPDALKKHKSRLINMQGFPKSLAKLIEPAGQGTYELKLAPSRIHVFELVEVTTLRKRSLLQPSGQLMDLAAIAR